MRKLIDILCASCGEIQEDRYVDLALMKSHRCGGRFERVLLGHSACVHGDDIPGGMEIKHGLCNPDGTPRRYYSKSEIAREAKLRGYENHVVHKTAPDTDKSKHTVRWV